MIGYVIPRMPQRKRLGEILIEACIITSEQLEEALSLQRSGQRRFIGQILVTMGWATEEDVCRAIAEVLRVKYVNVQDALISQEIVQLVPEPLASKRNILPLFIQDKKLYLAMENPLDVDVIQRIEFHTGMQVVPLIAPPNQLRESIRKHYNVEEYVGSMLGQVTEEQSVRLEKNADESVDMDEMRKISEGSQIVKLANLLISEGIKKRASDIHIEPTATVVNVRYRIDGMLSKSIRIPKWLQLPLISRLKVLAGMDIAEHRKPQDGRISVTYTKRKIDLRVSTLRTNFGEKMVLRILDSKVSSHDLNRLGFSSKQLCSYRQTAQQPQGWILVTGPTGSGKTTTLYATLNGIKDETKNIVTVEDPIEYQLEGINQVQINPKAGLTFASGLRSILRQDPNVILIGEIRDAETAQIAMQASETGHLVLSTLHTNDAVSTISRLFNLGVSPEFVASNVLVIIAQRLVRKVCPGCKIAYTPTVDELRSLGVALDHDEEFTCYKGQGCSTCNHTGYYGQTGVYELLVLNDALREAITQRPTKHALKKLAIEAGMRTLLDDGIEKVRQGITTLEDVARVCLIDQDVAASRPQPAERIAAPEKEAQKFCPQCAVPVEHAWNVCPFCATILKESLTGLPQSIRPFVQPIQTEVDKQAIRIVVADDEPQIRDMVTLLLEQQGYQVIPAVDGDDALEKIRTELADLIVLDVNMPKRNGFSVCKNMRSSMETMFIPVVMLTGQDSLEEKLEGLSSGADDYITKPFEAKELLARIETVLRRSYHQPAAHEA